jgi:uncharacterized protein YndB with AHSA1/START domain
VRVQTTRVSRIIHASRSAVYAALLDPDAIARWRAPDDMECFVHYFDPREGGAYRISLRYKDPHRVGKSSGHTDTYHGQFLRIVPDEEVVETMQFEADDPALRGPMTLTTTLNDVDEGTEVVMRHGGIPDAVPAADNELGTRMALANLACIVERPANT